MRASADGGRPHAGRPGDPRAPRGWTAATVPQELVDILDERAGRQHGRTGPVLSALAEILNAYDQLSFRS